MKTSFTHGLAALLASVVLAACGGGDSNDGGTTTPPPATASVTGHVVDMDSDLAVADATVSAGSASTKTAADGSFTLTGVTPAERVGVKVEAAGHGANVAVVKLTSSGTGNTADIRVRLLKLAAPQTFDAAAAATLGNAAGTAQVALPANSLVDATTGAAAAGAVSVSVTPIDPARDPERMPGGYTTLQNGSVRTIESFGAVKVDLRDAQGNRLNLKPGSSATVRIPLSTRSPNPPASVPLWHFDEASARWVQEGTATLAGTGANQYYEGTVTHFSYWNADQIAETVELEGCVKTADGKPAANVLVSTSGVDYSGRSSAVTDDNGHFVVQVRKNSTTSVWAATDKLVTPIHQVTMGSENGAMTECMVLETATTGSKLAPKVTSNPRAQTVAIGETVMFYATIDGTQPMVYAWLRNGVEIPGADSNFLWLPAVTLADNGAVYSLRGTNAAGSVTTVTAKLTVSATPIPPTLAFAPRDLTVDSGETAVFSVAVNGSAPFSYQWKRNGQPIAGATAAVYTFATVDADDGALFSVTVANAGGTLQTDAAKLTVVPAQSAPVITTQPQGIIVNVGSPAVFAVEAKGSAPLSYQWQRNGTDIAGATANVLRLEAVTAADNGAQFQVVAKNPKGSVTSAAATLTVNQASDDQQAKLLALMTAWLPGMEAAGAPLQFADDDFKVLAVGAVCGGGTAGVTLDGAAAPAAGTTLPTGNHTLAAQFNACRTESSSLYTGGSSLAYSFADLAHRVGSAQSTATDFRVTADDINGDEKTSRVQGNAKVELDGSLNGMTETTKIRYLPANGLTVTDVASQSVSTFSGGTALMHTVTQGVEPTAQTLLIREEYAQLAFSRGGVNYVVDGFFQLDFGTQPGSFSGSGTVTISGNGQVIGRVRGTAGGLVVEIVDGGLLGSLPPAKPLAAKAVARALGQAAARGR
jgi:hypothetical protein